MRLDRWREEVELLLEEMARVLRFFSWRVLEWSRLVQTNDAGVQDGALFDGRNAYALQQASQFQAMRSHCEQSWRDVSEWVQKKHGSTMKLPQEFINLGKAT